MSSDNAKLVVTVQSSAPSLALLGRSHSSIPEDAVFEEISDDKMMMMEDGGEEETEDDIYNALFTNEKVSETTVPNVSSCWNSSLSSAAASMSAKSNNSSSCSRWGDSMESMEFSYDFNNNDNDGNENDSNNNSNSNNNDSIRIRGNSRWSTLNDSFQVYNPDLRNCPRDVDNDEDDDVLHFSDDDENDGDDDNNIENNNETTIRSIPGLPFDHNNTTSSSSVGGTKKVGFSTVEIREYNII